jgi:hypothetical protein
MGSAISGDLETITEEDLKNLERDEIPEGLRLEFKREVNVNKPDWGSEIAKDVTALANTDGGRLFYGIEQKLLTDGRTVAGPIRPLTDPTLEDRIRESVLAHSHPRPRFRAHDVKVAGGHVKVVEVYASHGQDLHMVSGKKELRFYRRNSAGTYPMTEPEIREAYSRIAISQARLEDTIERALAREIDLRPKAEQAVFVVPWYSRPKLVEPRLFPEFRTEFWEGPLKNSTMSPLAEFLRLTGDGFVASNKNLGDEIAPNFLAIRKHGLIHYSDARPSFGTKDARSFSLHDGAEFILDALLLATLVYSRTGYWGPVRIIYRLAFDSNVDLFLGSRRRPHFRGIPAGVHEHVVPQVDLNEAGPSRGPIVRDLLDQVCHHTDRSSCPWFDETGNLRADVEDLSERLRELFRRE